MTRNTGKYSILFAVTATQFAVPFMLSSVGVALPTIGEHFQAGAVALSLIESIYIGVTSMFLLPFGRLSDMIGHGPVFRVGQVIFCLATLALSLAWSTQSFIAIRMFQGFGGAMTLATGLADGWTLKAAVLLQPALSVLFFPAGFTAAARIFPERIRNVAISLMVPVAVLVGNGLTPFLLGWAGDQGSFALGFAVQGAAVLSGLALLRLVHFPPAHARSSDSC